MLENFINNLNGTERAELENYCANKFVKQNNLDEDNQEFLNLWRGIIKLKSCSAGQILNEHICHKRPVKFNRPEDINIIIYNSIAGELPVIKFGDISDFENFIINLLYKGLDDINNQAANLNLNNKLDNIDSSANSVSNKTINAQTGRLSLYTVGSSPNVQKIIK